MIRELKISSGYIRTQDPFDVKIEFGTAKKLRDFVHNIEYLCKVDKFLVKIIKIKKFRHTSMEATIQKISLREYNLERILS